MFGIASVTPDGVFLDGRMHAADELSVMERLRTVLRRHALMRKLNATFESGSLITADDVILALKEINPSASYNQNTWQIYAERLGLWFVASGHLRACNVGWILEDQGKVRIPSKRGSRFRIGCFLGDAPPAKVVESLHWLANNQPQTADAIRIAGYRNSIRVLDRLDLTSRDDDGNYITVHDIPNEEAANERVQEAARSDETLLKVWGFLQRRPSATGPEIGAFINDDEEQKWQDSSRSRIGNALWHWASWIGQVGSAKAPGPRSQRKTPQKRPPNLFP
jgi:hypothetical protein